MVFFFLGGLRLVTQPHIVVSFRGLVHLKGVLVIVLFFYRSESLFEATRRVRGPHDKARSVRLVMTTLHYMTYFVYKT